MAFVRIAGVSIDGRRQIWIGLTDIYGIGRSSGLEICEKMGLKCLDTFDGVGEQVVEKIRAHIADNYVVEADARRVERQNIAIKKELNTYQGVRHKRRLPVHGQRTKTNSRTRRGKAAGRVGAKKK